MCAKLNPWTYINNKLIQKVDFKSKSVSDFLCDLILKKLMTKKSCRKQKGVLQYFHIEGETDSYDKIYIFFLGVQLCINLQLLGSELTETTTQIVMEFYILISVIMMVHRTGGEKYTHQSHHSYAALVSKHTCCLIWFQIVQLQFTNIPTRHIKLKLLS